MSLERFRSISSLGHWGPGVNNDTGNVGGNASRNSGERHSELINVGLDLTAANGTKIPFIGWADVRVRLPSPTKEGQEVHVPFLVTVDR